MCRFNRHKNRCALLTCPTYSASIITSAQIVLIEGGEIVNRAEFRALRRGRITAGELGRICGKSERAIRSYETGERRPKPEVAFKIGGAVGLTESQVIEVFYAEQKGA